MWNKLTGLMLTITIVTLGGSVASTQPPALTPVEQLGRFLFFDKISAPGPWMSCATCHGPEVGWTGPIPGNNIHGGVYRGAMPTRFGNRKPPAASYATFSPVFAFDSTLGEFVGGNFWDGRATGERLGNPAAEQALGPFLNPLEQNMPSKTAVCEHVAASKYAGLFEQVWGIGTLDCSPSGVDDTYDRFGLSIAAYEGSPEVSPFNSKFDDYWRACLAAGNTDTACGLVADGDRAVLDPAGILTDKEWDGFIEFSEYCSQCHTSTAGPDGAPPLFTDFTFANLGLPRNPRNPFYGMDDEFLDDGQPINPLGEDYVDFGLGEFLLTRPEWAHLAWDNDGKQRVPTLRNVDKRPGKEFSKAYMHNGVLKDLKDVVHFYNTRDVPGAGWAPPEVDRNISRELLTGKPLGNLELDEDAENAIVEFLKTLTDRNVKGR